MGSPASAHGNDDSGERRDALVIECQIECRRGMGERSDADPIDAGLGQGSHRDEIDTAGGLELNPRRGRITPADGLGDCLGPEVIDQDDLGRALEGEIELIEGIDLDFNDGARRSGAIARRRLKSRRDSGRRRGRLP